MVRMILIILLFFFTFVLVFSWSWYSCSFHSFCLLPRRARKKRCRSWSSNSISNYRSGKKIKKTFIRLLNAKFNFLGDNRLGSMETGTALVRAMIKVMQQTKEKPIHVINMSYGEHAHWSFSG